MFTSLESDVETNKNTADSREISKRASESDASSVVSDSVSEKPRNNSAENKTAPEPISEVAPEKLPEVKSAKLIETHSIELNLDEIFKEPLVDLNAVSCVFSFGPS